MSTSTDSIALLDDEGALSDALYTILRRLFTYYATLDPAPAPAPPTEGATEVEELELAEDAKDELWLTRAGLDAFAKGTNGKAMDDETFVEVYTYFHCVAVLEGETRIPGLTFKGFVQLYELQTSAEESETRKDLKAWGYDEQLELVNPPSEELRRALETACPQEKVQEGGADRAREKESEEVLERVAGLKLAEEGEGRE